MSHALSGPSIPLNRTPVAPSNQRIVLASSHLNAVRFVSQKSRCCNPLPLAIKPSFGDGLLTAPCGLTLVRGLTSSRPSFQHVKEPLAHYRKSIAMSRKNSPSRKITPALYNKRVTLYHFPRLASKRLRDPRGDGGRAISPSFGWRVIASLLCDLQRRLVVRFRLALRMLDSELPTLTHTGGTTPLKPSLRVREMNAMLGGDLANPLHVRAASFCALVRAAPKKLFEPRRRRAKEHAERFVADIPERVNDGSREEHPCSYGNFLPLTADEKAAPAFLHQKPFVLVQMIMRWWPTAGRHSDHSQHHRPAGLLAAQKHSDFVAEGTEDAAVAGRCCRNRGCWLGIHFLANVLSVA